MRAVNPETGEVLELRGGQWVAVDSGGKQEPAKAPERLTTGPINAAMVSAGDQLVNMGRNVRDVWAGIRGDKQAQGDIAVERAEAEQMRGRLHQEAPWAAGIGAALPSLATLPIGGGIGVGRLGALGADVATGAAGRIATNLGTSAALGGLSSTSGEIGSDAGIGAGLAGAGGLASNMVSRVVAGRAAMAQSRAQQAAQQAVGGLDDAQRETLAGAQRVGMQVTPGQALGDRTLRQIEASASRNPVLSPYWQQMKGANEQRLNGLAARAIGVEADNLGPQVLAQAEHQIGRQFREVGEAMGQVDVTPLLDKINSMAKAEKTRLAPRKELEQIAANFASGAEARAAAALEGGPAANLIRGVDLMEQRSEISGRMRDAFANKKSAAGKLYSDVLDAIDETMMKAATKTSGDPTRGVEIGQLYDKTRDQFSVLRALHRGGVSPDGQLMQGKMAQMMNQSDKTRYFGRADDMGNTLQLTGTGRVGDEPLGDFYDALRFSTSKIGRDIVGDSGTATALATSGMFEGGPVQIAGRAAGAVARRMVAGPLAQRYMQASPEAAAAWAAALEQSALKGWAAGQAAGGAGARAGQGLQQSMQGMNESGMLPPGY